VVKKKEKENREILLRISRSPMGKMHGIDRQLLVNKQSSFTAPLSSRHRTGGSAANNDKSSFSFYIH